MYVTVQTAPDHAANVPAAPGLSRQAEEVAAAMPSHSRKATPTFPHIVAADPPCPRVWWPCRRHVDYELGPVPHDEAVR